MHSSVTEGVYATALSDTMNLRPFPVSIGVSAAVND